MEQSSSSTSTIARDNSDKKIKKKTKIHVLKKFNQKEESDNNNINVAIQQFLTKVHEGPNYVSTCCHRMMYRENVVECNFSDLSTCVDQLVYQKIFDKKFNLPTFNIGYVQHVKESYQKIKYHLNPKLIVYQNN